MYTEDLQFLKEDKDVSKSCVFDFPDRPIDSLPPDYPPPGNPVDYPYNPIDDWPFRPDIPPILPFPPDPPAEPWTGFRLSTRPAVAAYNPFFDDMMIITEYYIIEMIFDSTFTFPTPPFKTVDFWNAALISTRAPALVNVIIPNPGTFIIAARSEVVGSPALCQAVWGSPQVLNILGGTVEIVPPTAFGRRQSMNNIITIGDLDVYFETLPLIIRVNGVPTRAQVIGDAAP